MAAKEERVEKEPEKPAWLVEAEARRKLHEQRRHNKTKQQGENDREQDKPVQDGIVLHSLSHRSDPVIDKSDSHTGANSLHNVMLRTVRKLDAVSTKSDEDNDANKSFNFCLRPVSKTRIQLKAQSRKRAMAVDIITCSYVLYTSRSQLSVRKPRTCRESFNRYV